MAAGLFGYPMAVARDRESGVFQRMRVTPIPMWTVSVSRIVVQLVLSLVMSLVVLGLGGIRHHLTFSLVNWLLVLAVSLLGAAVFLAMRAQAGRFDGVFYAVQALELAAGAANLALIGLNIRDGLRLGRLRRRPQEQGPGLASRHL